MKDGCVFCQIIAEKIPAKFFYRDELISVFEDIHPIATVHYLVVPNRHILSMNEVKPEDVGLLSHMIMVARDLAIKAHISESGYRLMINTGKDGSQTVQHLHLHLIGGRQLLGRDVS